MREGSNIFISHNHLDGPVADALNKALTTLLGANVTVSYSTKRDDGGIPSGDNWFRWIGQQVKSSQITLLLLTPSSVARQGWLLWESGAVFGVALAEGAENSRRVRPLVYRLLSEKIPDPLRAANLQVVRGDDQADMRQFFRELILEPNLLTGSQIMEATPRLDAVTETYLLDVRTALDESNSSREQSLAGIAPILTKSLEGVIEGIRTFLPKAKINGRYFYLGKDGGREVLVRADKVLYESEPMPGEFGFRSVDIEKDADSIVICKAFKFRTPIYQVLTADLYLQYRDDLKQHIDPGQGWVLACPVLRGDDSAAGVVCLYGRKPPVRNDNEDEERRLKQVAVTLSEIFDMLLP